MIWVTDDMLQIVLFFVIFICLFLFTVFLFLRYLSRTKIFLDMMRNIGIAASVLVDAFKAHQLRKNDEDNKK